MARHLRHIEGYLHGVDFSRFVAELMHGVYHCIVDSSIEQMEAYTKLLAEIGATIEEFRDSIVACDDERDYLSGNFDDDGTVSRSRQQLLATMVLMGLNGIVVTHGRVRTN